MTNNGLIQTPDRVADDFDAFVDGHVWSTDRLVSIIDHRLGVLLPKQNQAPQLLHMALAYTVLAPGKRIRPLITLLTSFHFGRRDLRALDCGCALEMIHAASLIMDDLPAMDNSEMRRGQPTSHRKFGEDIALLSSVALLNMAFGVVASCETVPASTKLELVRLLSSAVGSNGLVGGQVMDMRIRSPGVAVPDLERLNQFKTGSLFAAAAEAGAMVAGVSGDLLRPIRQFALEMGLAFQIADDVLDGAEYAGRIGKDTGKDADKATLVTTLGKESARQMYHVHVANCFRSLEEIGATEAPLGVFVRHCMSQVDM